MSIATSWSPCGTCAMSSPVSTRNMIGRSRHDPHVCELPSALLTRCETRERRELRRNDEEGRAMGAHPPHPASRLTGSDASIATTVDETAFSIGCWRPGVVDPAELPALLALDELTALLADDAAVRTYPLALASAIFTIAQSAAARRAPAATVGFHAGACAIGASDARNVSRTPPRSFGRTVRWPARWLRSSWFARCD